ncbi:MAG: pilus assembly PilX family protein [Gemmatimonadales bacterium]
MNRIESRREGGFAMLVAIFALLIMSTVAVAALIGSDDERRSSRAVRAANVSFYGAEAGLHKVWADSAFMDSLNTGKFTVAPGGSRGLGWRTMPNGVQYNVTLRRYDNGGQAIYGLVAEGRGAKGLAGQQLVTFLMTSIPGAGGYRLGACCQAAATIRGDVYLEGYTPNTKLQGNDGNPPIWDTNGRCTGVPLQNKPGVLMKDTLQYSSSSNSSLVVNGNPKKAQDATIDSTTFLQYGSLTFNQLKAMANIVIDASGGDITHALLATTNTNGTCKTTDIWNWGSSSPAHACYNYFPIVLIKGEVTISGGYGQGLVIMDRIGSPLKGSEFELQGNSTAIFAGIAVGFGCPEIQNGHQMWGSLFADKITAANSCYSDLDASLHMEKGSSLQWSNCVVQTVLQMTGVAAASGGGPAPGGLVRVTRGFGTSLR